MFGLAAQFPENEVITHIDHRFQMNEGSVITRYFLEDAPLWYLHPHSPGRTIQVSDQALRLEELVKISILHGVLRKCICFMFLGSQGGPAMPWDAYNAFCMVSVRMCHLSSIRSHSRIKNFSTSESRILLGFVLLPV